MKRIVTLILTGMLVLMMGLQALAAPSIVGGYDRGQVHADQGTVTWETPVPGSLPDELIKLVEQINQSPAGVTVQESFGDIDLSDINVYDNNSKFLSVAGELPGRMYYLSPMLQLSFHDSEPTEENPVHVTFTVNNMNSSMDVYVLCYCPEHGWELLKAERTGDNQVTVAFHSKATLAAVVYVDNGVNADGSEGTAPKTGESSMGVWMAVMAVVFAAVGVFAVRRSRKVQ